MSEHESRRVREGLVSATTHQEYAELARGELALADSFAARSFQDEADRCLSRAQVCATLAVYEALVLPGYGTSVGEQAEYLREAGA